jgi:hypothetical protein
VVPMLLEFRGFLAERATNTLTELQFCSGPGCIKIGETFSAEVFHLRKKFLKVLNTTAQFFDRGSFRPHAGLF